MTIAVPRSGQCATHPGVQADWACQRCGSFVCKDCERRTRPDAPPLCPKCWALREQVVQDQVVTESRRLQIAGLVLGCVSFLHPLLMVGSAVLNLRELLSGRGGTNRWMNVAGASLTGLAVLTWTMVIIYFVIRA